MILSALIFGYFGFTMSTTASDGAFVLFMALLTWTLRISCIVFAACALITTARPIAGNLLYALAGVVGAGLFIVVAVMDVADRNYAAGIQPVLLFVFAAWNGYGSWFCLRSVLALRRGGAAAEESGTAAGK